MSDIPSFPYAGLWGERSMRSVANLTRDDAREPLALAPRVPVRTHVTTYPLDAADDGARRRARRAPSRAPRSSSRGSPDASVTEFQHAGRAAARPSATVHQPNCRGAAAACPAPGE